MRNLKKILTDFRGKISFFPPFCLKSNCHLSPNFFLIPFYHTDVLFHSTFPRSILQWLGNLKIDKTGRDKKCENKRVPHIFVKPKSSQHICSPVNRWKKWWISFTMTEGLPPPLGEWESQGSFQGCSWTPLCWKVSALKLQFHLPAFTIFPIEIFIFQTF